MFLCWFFKQIKFIYIFIKTKLYYYYSLPGNLCIDRKCMGVWHEIINICLKTGVGLVFLLTLVIWRSGHVSNQLIIMLKHTSL